MNRILSVAALLVLCAAAASCAPHAGEPAQASASPGRQAFERYPNPDPKGPFARAVRVGDLVLLSGQIGLREDDTLPEDFDEQAHQVMRNIEQDLEAIGLGMDAVAKCTVMIEDISLWGRFNQIYAGYFASDQLPARSAFGASGLALGAAVEVECIAHDGRG